jgi:hypothetical protein
MPSVSFTFAPSGLMIVTQALKGRIMPRMGAAHLGEPEDTRSPSTSPSIAYSPSI